MIVGTLFVVMVLWVLVARMSFECGQVQEEDALFLVHIRCVDCPGVLRLRLRICCVRKLGRTGAGVAIVRAALEEAVGG